MDSGRLVGTCRHDSARAGSTLGGVGGAAVASAPKPIPGLWFSSALRYLREQRGPNADITSIAAKDCRS